MIQYRLSYTLVEICLIFIGIVEWRKDNSNQKILIGLLNILDLSFESRRLKNYVKGKNVLSQTSLSKSFCIALYVLHQLFIQP